MTMKLKKFNIRWTGNTVPNDEEVAQTILELNKIVDNLDEACSLITHTVILTDDLNGPSVHVYGLPEDKENLYATFSMTTEWSNITGEEDE